MQKPIHMMLEIIGKCYKLDKDLVPLLKLKARQAVDVECLEKFLKKQLEKLSDEIMSEYDKAYGLVNQFKQY